MPSLFGTDGVRGRANCYPVTPEIALALGKALAHVSGAQGSGGKRALIGKDTRLSGYMLETALTSGLVSMGMDVFLVGPVPTPAVAMLTHSMNADVGIMLTASHNPFDDNGIKVFDSRGFKLPDELEAEVERHVLSGELTSEHIRSDQLGKAFRIEDARGRYIQFAKASVGDLRLNGMRVVLDCANGAAYQIAPWIFKELGAEVIKVHADPDGFNINRECGALHPATVGEWVRKYRADIGIAFDGDADRVIFTDQHGDPISGDAVLGACARAMKADGVLRKDTLVVTVMSNLGLHEALRADGITVEETAVGDRQVIARMREGGFNLGGENSGHIIFMDHATTGDGIISALNLLKLMRRRNCSVQELVADIPMYPQELVNLPVREKRPVETLPALGECMAACRQALGQRGRILVRYSGTENVLRLMVEAAETGMVREWCAKLEAAARRDLG